MTSASRKALLQKYKETPRPMGVGRIRNTVNDSALVVAGTHISALLNRHQAQLKMGGHPHREMQRDFTDQGADAFTFEVLDTLEPSDEPGYDPAGDLRVLEAMWMERLAPYAPAGYHPPPGAAS
jgi:hypothetical protein